MHVVLMAPNYIGITSVNEGIIKSTFQVVSICNAEPVLLHLCSASTCILYICKLPGLLAS